MTEREQLIDDLIAHAQIDHPPDDRDEAAMKEWADRCVKGALGVLEAIKDGRAVQRAGLIYVVDQQAPPLPDPTSAGATP